MTDLIGAGVDLGLPDVLSKNYGVPTTDQPQKAKDFTSDQEVRWCPGCGDYVILNTMRNFLPELRMTKSPGATPVTPSPTASTTPAASCPSR